MRRPGNASASQGLIDATSNESRPGCWANTIQRGARVLTAARVSRIAILAAIRAREARDENSRPRLSSVSIRPESEARPKIPTVRSSRVSVRIGFLHVIDDEEFAGTSGGFELQSELFLYRGKHRWAGSVIKRCEAGCRFVGHKFQMKIEHSRDGGFVHDGAVGDEAEPAGKLIQSHRVPVHCYFRSSSVDAAGSAEIRMLLARRPRGERLVHIEDYAGSFCNRRQFHAGFCHLKRINWHLSGLAVDGQSEAVFEQRLKHRPAHDFEARIPFGFRVNQIARRTEPGGTS